MTGLQNSDFDKKIEPVLKSLPHGYQPLGRLTTSRPKKRLKSSANSHTASFQNDAQPGNRPNAATTSGSSQSRRYMSNVKLKTCRRQSQTVDPERTPINSQGAPQIPKPPHESPKSSRHRAAPAKSVGGGSTSRPTPSRVSTIHPREIFETRPLPSTPSIAKEPKPRDPLLWKEDISDHGEKEKGVTAPALRTKRVAAASTQVTQRGSIGHCFETTDSADSVGGLRGYLDGDFRPVRRPRVPSGDTVIEISSTEEMEENDRVNRTVLHYGLRGKPFGRAARKAQVGPTRVGSDDSDSCTTTSPFDDDVERARVRRSFNTSRKGLDHRAARKSLPSVVMVGSDDSDSWSTTTSHIGESESDTEDSEIQVIEPPVFTSRTTGALRTCSGSILTPQEIRSDEAPTLELVQALKGCVLRLPEGRLPFLRRNLRVGFEATCKARRVETMVTSGERMTVETVYLYPIDTLDERRYGSLTRKLEAWTCPLCSLHLQFANRYVLQKHLEWDHAEVKMRWTNSREEGKVTKWMIEIILPLPSKPGKDLSYIHPNFVFATYVRNPAILELTSLATTHDLRHMLGDKGKAREVSMGPELELRTSFTRKSARVDSKDTTLQSSKDAFTPDFDFKQLTGRYASPPRLNFEDSSDPPDPLGPTAQFPFLPAVSDDEKTTLNYSCRIGGPKIYDLLGTLSQEQFGTLSWVVLDREEEIFEVDDVKDEHKVMHALWARWIILHRMTFIRNYHDGVRMFIDQYWKMIRVAAGWEALRYWLLVLLANRFLTGHEVAELLKYYQKKVGWDESI